MGDEKYPGFVTVAMPIFGAASFQLYVKFMVILEAFAGSVPEPHEAASSAFHGLFSVTPLYQQRADPQ